MSRRALVAVLLLCACREPVGPRAPDPRPSAIAGATVLDALDAIGGWQASGSEGVTAAVRRVDSPRGGALRLEFDLGGTSGYAVARRALPLDLPEDFELAFELRGALPVNHFEVKLLDASGENVWWHRRANFAFPADWQRFAIKRRQIEFAWGPTKDRALRRIAAIEIVVAAGQGGGRGAIEIDQLVLRPRTPVPVPPPAPVASPAAARAAIDGRADTSWRARGPTQLTLDLGVERDLGGLLVRWGAGGHASDYGVDLSLDGRSWQRAAAIAGGDGGLDPIPLLEASARYIRLDLARAPAAVELAEIELLEAPATVGAASRNAFVAALARHLPRGWFPRAWIGEQPYWTIVGVDGGKHAALLSEDGALELGGPALGASVEPFVEIAGQPTGWAGVPEITQSLDERYLPIPRVVWRTPAWELEVTALGIDGTAPGAAGGTAPQLAARYTLRNRGDAPLDARLVLAVRPLQVNPPTQFLNIAGGARPIHELAWSAGALSIDGAPALRPLTPPDQVALWPLHALGYPAVPVAATPTSVRDPAGLASAALAYRFALPARGEASVVLHAPLAGALTAAPAPPAGASAWFTAALAATRARWHAALDRVAFRVPAAGAPLVDTLRTSLAYMLISRDGPILRPGTRSYARAWIRDGAMISEAMLRLGHPQVARDFLAWYAPFQFASGRVPCCVEPTGAVPVAEHDSHGQLIFLAAEIYRYTRDRAGLAAVWPRLLAAARAIDALRATEPSGLLPPSISHEGYSAKPAYAYWDDFWGITGLDDAAWLAGELRDPSAAERATSRDAFRRDVLASVSESAARHRVPYIPGAADLGDFDATSTTIALAPAGLQRALPPALLRATFERAWDQLVARRPDGTWVDYTPYELRLIGTFVRLGWRERAEQGLARYFADRRPTAWNQWAEVVGRVPREPRFLGDMPHAWVHSDYARAALDLFAYYRPEDRALVLAAGIPAAWFAGPGFAIDHLATPFGPLGYDVRARGREVAIRIGPGEVPPGGLVLPWPFPGAPGRARVDGRPAPWTQPFAGEPPALVIRRRPATILLTRPE